jgi:hypothetical protein
LEVTEHGQNPNLKLNFAHAVDALLQKLDPFLRRDLRCNRRHANNPNGFSLPPVICFAAVEDTVLLTSGLGLLVAVREKVFEAQKGH